MRDLDEALRFYCGVLGFTEAWKFGEPPHRAGVQLDGAEIQLDAASVGGPHGPAVLYCHMVGVDEYYQACRRRGAVITMALADRPWGARDFRVVDPSGNRLGFAEVLTK